MYIVLAISINNISEMLSSERLKKLCVLALTAVIAVPGIMHIIAVNIDMMKYDHNSIKYKVLESIPERAAVMAPPLYYFSFLGRGNRFTTYLFIEERCPNFESEIEQLEIDYILIDESMMHVTNKWCSGNYFTNEIMAFLQAKAILEKIIDIQYPNSLTNKRMIEQVYLYKLNSDSIKG